MARHEMAAAQFVRKRIEAYYARKRRQGARFTEFAWFKGRLSQLRPGVERWPGAKTGRSVMGSHSRERENTMIHTHLDKVHLHQRDVEVWMKKYFLHTDGALNNCVVAVMKRHPKTGKYEVGAYTYVRIAPSKVSALLRFLKGQASSLRIYNLGMAIKRATTAPERQTYRKMRKFFQAKIVPMPGFKKKTVGGSVSIVRERSKRK